MAVTKEEIRTIIEAQDRATAVLKKIQKQTDDTEASFFNLNSVGKKLVAGAAGFVAFRTVGAILVNVTKAASNMQEELQKFSTVFASVGDLAIKERDKLVKSFDLSRLSATKLLAATGDLLTGFGFTDKAALDLSSQVQSLSADLVSFSNFEGGVTGASEILTKALLGEREALISLGIKISEAELKQAALAKGIQLTNGRLSKQDTALLTLELALKQSGKAIGDVARSQGTFATENRKLQNSLEDLSTSVGAFILPSATKLFNAFNKVAGIIIRFTDSLDKSKETTRSLQVQLERLNLSLLRDKLGFEKLSTGIRNITKDQANEIKVILKGREQRKISQAEAKKLGEERARQAKIQEELDKKATERNKAAIKAAKESAKERIKAEKDFIKTREDQAKAVVKLQASLTKDELTNVEERKKAGEELRQLQIDAGLISLQSQRETLEAQLAQQIEFSEMEKELFGKTSEEQLAREQGLQNQLVDINKQAEENKRDDFLRTISAAQRGTSAVLGGLAAVAAVNKDASKENFRIFQAAAIAEATVAAALAFTKTLATVPFPLNIFAAAGIALTAGAQVATIAKQKPNFQTSEGEFRTVPGPDNLPIPAIVHGGEQIGRPGPSQGNINITFEGDILNGQETMSRIQEGLVDLETQTGRRAIV